MLIADVSLTGHEREPTFWFGIHGSDAIENSMPCGRVRLSDRVQLDADHLSRPRPIDLGSQRPTNATSFHRLIQAFAAWMQVDPATRLGLRRIDHAHTVAGDDP
jgi:hypothetical protein